MQTKIVNQVSHKRILQIQLPTIRTIFLQGTSRSKKLDPVSTKKEGCWKLQTQIRKWQSRIFCVSARVCVASPRYSLCAVSIWQGLVIIFARLQKRWNPHWIYLPKRNEEAENICICVWIKRWEWCGTVQPLCSRLRFVGIEFCVWTNRGKNVYMSDQMSAGTV